MKKLLGLIALILTMSGCQPPPEPLSIVGNSGLGFHPVYAQHLIHPEQHPENLNVTMLVSEVMETIAKLSGLPQPELMTLMNQITYFSAAASAEYLQKDYVQTSALISAQLLTEGIISRVRSLPICAGTLE